MVEQVYVLPCSAYKGTVPEVMNVNHLKTDKPVRNSRRSEENESHGREVEHQFVRRPQASPSRPSDGSRMIVNTFEWRIWQLAVRTAEFVK
jgi:hypothetical protein